MQFVDLKRSFIPLLSGERATRPLSWTRNDYAGALSWPSLLSRARVVLLAEANSGKTAEFRDRSVALRAEGKAAFFVKIEDLADGSLADALTPEDEQNFSSWKSNDDSGWFFLDSVDEARLQNKSFERAIKRFRRELGPALGRANVLISCRVSDWRGNQDVDIITDHLPVPALSSERSRTPDELLLNPLFGDEVENKRRTKVLIRARTTTIFSLFALPD